MAVSTVTKMYQKHFELDDSVGDDFGAFDIAISEVMTHPEFGPIACPAYRQVITDREAALYSVSGEALKRAGQAVEYPNGQRVLIEDLGKLNLEAGIFQPLIDTTE